MFASIFEWFVGYCFLVYGFFTGLYHSLRHGYYVREGITCPDNCMCCRIIEDSNAPKIEGYTRRLWCEKCGCLQQHEWRPTAITSDGGMKYKWGCLWCGFYLHSPH